MLLNWALTTNWMFPLLFSLKDALSKISKDKFQVSICLATEPFSTLPEYILNELWLREDSRCTVFTVSDFWKCSWAQTEISLTEWCLVLMQCCLRAWRSWGSNTDFQPCPCMSPGFPNIFFTILFTIDGGICSILQFNVEEHYSDNCSTICRHNFLQIAESLPIFTWEILCSFYTQSCYWCAAN